MRFFRGWIFLFAMLSLSLASDDFSSIPRTQPEREKTVLYLGGGIRSPWYSLGALYAVRDYRISVDSVVGTSWGAFVGSLWASGFELDEIQRILTDTLFVSQVLPQASRERLLDLPIAFSGEPALALRFSFFGDSSGRARLKPKSLEPDAAFLKKSLFRLRLQEALTRTDSTRMPFSALACEAGLLVPSTVMEAIPLSSTSGEKCLSFFPDDSTAFSIYVMAYPVRNDGFAEEPLAESGFQSALAFIRTQKASGRRIVTVRPHSLAESSPLEWMQAGYSDMERKLGELSSVVARNGESFEPSDSILPRFKIEPAFERIPSIYYSDISSRWDFSDTGIDAPSNFLKRIANSPFYDSVQIKMDSAGVASVSASASSILEFRLGGFGSNLTGPLAYAGVDFRFVNQFEYALSVDGFVGEHSYAIRPGFLMRGFFSYRGEFSAWGNIARKRPLLGYFGESTRNLRIRELRENDAEMRFAWKDSLADFSLDVLIGKSEFRTFQETEALFVNTLYPKLSFVRNRDGFEEWFGDEGYRISGSLGFRSVNLTDGTGDAPLYLAMTFDAQKFFAPTRFVSLGLGALAGIHIRRESGKGYVYPDPLSTWSGGTIRSVDLWYRMHPALSPWSESWNFLKSATHHYAAARASLGLHGRLLGAWLFAAYMRDFEENPFVDLDANRLLLEPTLRFAYRTLDLRLGLHRIVSLSDFSKLKNIGDFSLFFQVGANW